MYVEWTFIQQTLNSEGSSNQIFSFLWHPLPEPAFSLLRWGYPFFRHRYPCIRIRPTHLAFWMAARSYVLYKGMSCMSTLVIAFECLYLPNNCSRDSLLSRWRGVSLQFPHEKVKREKRKWQSLDRWRNVTWTPYCRVSKESIFISCIQGKHLHHARHAPS